MPRGCRKSKQTSWGEGHSLPWGWGWSGGLSSEGWRRHIRGPSPVERPGMSPNWGRRLEPPLCPRGGHRLGEGPEATPGAAATNILRDKRNVWLGRKAPGQAEPEGPRSRRVRGSGCQSHPSSPRSSWHRRLPQIGTGRCWPSRHIWRTCHDTGQLLGVAGRSGGQGAAR